MRKRFYNMKNEEWKAISKQDMACKNTLNFVFVVVEASRIIFLNFTVTIFFLDSMEKKIQVLYRVGSLELSRDIICVK